ncbi:hypothetical protein SLE2022_022240 [Rubroshorea leprosula]
MERNSENPDEGNEFHPNPVSASNLSSNLSLDNVGEVTLTLNSDGLSWKLLDPMENVGSTCCGIESVHEVAGEIKFSDIYAVELTNYGVIHECRHPGVGKCFLAHESHNIEMHRFIVHGVQKSKSQPCLWVLASYTFGHKDLETCQKWAKQIDASLNMEVERPKNLLVFVHPMSGKANGRRTWETVAPIFSRSKITTKVLVTERAGHAFDVMASTTNEELNSYDGAVAVGGDGFFNEILNGLLLRHKAPFPPAPSDFIEAIGTDGSSPVHGPDEIGAENHQKEEDPLLVNPRQIGMGFSNSRTDDASSSNIDQDSEFPLPNQRFRFGIIPAGSTDAIVICTTGARDPVTSALHIVLGKRICLDVAQVVRWKTTLTSNVEPCIRYAASFAGYGFYGDVITESEKYRWMGPKRYDYAGTKVFLGHRSYEAEIAYLEVEPEKPKSGIDGGRLINKVRGLLAPKNSERIICRSNCKICTRKAVYSSMRSPRATPYSRIERTRWLRTKGRFLSVGAAIMSNRNERAPDGLVADAHLADGFLHLLLIKDCPHAFYLWHLMQLAKKGGNPLNFDFVEYHKTSAFTFTSSGKQSSWNLDGELFQAHKLSAQVFQGLISLFAAGPEV